MPHDFEYGAVRPDNVELDLDAPLPTQLEPPFTAPITAAAVLDLVLIPLCKREHLPLLLRMGTRRKVSPPLGLLGDGLGPARMHSLGHLCASHPEVKFLA